MRPTLALALLALCRPAAAQFIVQPGDTGELEYAIHNDAASIGPVSGVVMTVDTGAVVRILSSGPAAAATLPPDGTVNFSFTYEIPADAPGGVAVVKLQPAASTVNLLPPMAALRADLEVSVTPEPIRAFDQSGSSQPLMEALFPQAPWLRAESLRFLLWDPDGVAGFDLLRGPGPVFELAFSTEMTNLPLNASLEVPQALLLDSPEFYVARINGGLGGVIDRYFLLDRNPPTIDLASAVFDPASGTVDLAGAALDAGSGIASVVKVLDPPGPGDGPPAYAGPTYPPGPSPAALGESGLSPGRYYFLARDRSSLAPPVGGTLVDSQLAAAGGACSRPGPPPNVPFFLGNGGHMLDSVFLNVDFRLANPSLQAAYNEGRLAFDGGTPSDIGSASVVLRSSSPESGAPLPGAWGVASSVAQTAEQTVLTASSLGPHTAAQSLALAPVVTSEIRVTSNTSQVGAQLTTYDAQGTPTVTPVTIPPGGIYPFTPPDASCEMRSASVTGFDEDSAQSIPVTPSDAAHISLDGIALDVPSFTSPGSVMVARVPFEPPPGYFRTSLVRDILLTAGYNPPLRITMPHEVEMPLDLLEKSEMWHLSNGTLSRISTAVDAFKATGEASSTSLFFLAIRDALPPETTVQFQGPSVTAGREVPVISGAAQVALSASDPTDGDSVATGVSGTYFLVDEVLVDSTTTPPLRFSSPFSLPEGRHTLSFTSIDRVGNAAFPDSASVDVDATAPSVVITSAPLFTRLPQPTFSATLTDSLAGLATGTFLVSVDGAGIPASVSFIHPGTFGAFENSSPLQIPVRSHAMAAMGRAFYVIGGHDNFTSGGIGQRRDTFWAALDANGSLGSWSPGPLLPEAMSSQAAAAADGYVYVMGGGNNSGASALVYYARTDPATGALLGTWLAGPALPMPVSDGDGAVVLTRGPRLYFINPAAPAVFVSDLNPPDAPLFPGKPGPWRTTTAPPQARAGASVVDWQGELYFLGGMASGTTRREVWVSAGAADGAITAWSRAADMPQPRAFGAAAITDGKLLYANGLDAGNQASDTAFVLDARAGTWSALPGRTPAPTYLNAAAGTAGVVVVTGGNAADGRAFSTTLAARLSGGGSVMSAVLEAVAPPLADGVHALVVGGEDAVANRGAASAAFSVDTTPPTLTLAAEGMALSSSAAIPLPTLRPVFSAAYGDALSGIDLASVSLFLDGADVTNLASSKDGAGAAFRPAADLAPGPHAFQAAVRDRAGNQAILLARVELDAEPPTVLLSSPAPGTFFASSTVTLSGLFEDAGLGLATATVRLMVDEAILTASLGSPPAPSVPAAWLPAPDIPVGLRSHAMAALGRTFYVIGGHDNLTGQRRETYYATLGTDGMLGNWAAGPLLPDIMSSQAAAAARGTVYVMGGGNNSGPSARFYYARVNNQATGALGPWTRGQDLPVPVSDGEGAVVLTYGAFLYFINPAAGAVWANPIGADGTPASQWQSAAAPGVALSGAQVAEWNGRLYMLGGASGGVARAQVWGSLSADPAGPVSGWERLADLPAPRAWGAVGAASGKVFYVGGLDQAGQPSPAAFVSDVSGGSAASWETLPAPYPAALWLQAAAGAEDALLVTGGNDNATGKAVRSAWLWRLPAPDTALAASATAYGLAEGAHEAKAEAADRAGNTAFSSAAFFVDLTPPDTQLVVMAASRTVNGDIYVLGATTVSFSPTDGPAGAASGVAQTLFAVGAGTEAPAGEFVTLPAGWSTLRFRSLDAVGNAEALKSAAVKLDAVAPSAVANLTGVAESSASVRFTWTSAGDDGATGDIADAEVRLDIRSDAGAFSVASARVVLASGTLSQGALLSFVAGGLLPGTPYRAAVFARDTAGNWSAASNEAAVQTVFIAQSTNAVAQLYSSDPDASLTVVPTTAQPAAYTVALASGLQPVAEFYELSAIITPESPAQLVFYLDASPGYSLDSLFIYTFDAMSGEWVSSPITNQEKLLLADGRIQVSGDLTHASLYAVMVRDTAPPLTAFAVLGSSAVLEGALFAAGSSSGVLTAIDQASVGGVASGVAATLYRGGAGTETTYNAPFGLPGGALEIFFHSIDKSGNSETEKRAAVFVDATAPNLSAAANLDAGTLSVTAEDAGAGLGSFSVVLDGAPILVEFVSGAVSVSTTLVLSPGTHVLHATAADRLGQAATLDRTYASDAVPPAVAFSFPRPDEPGLCRLAQGPVQVRGTVNDASLASWNLSEGVTLLGSGSANTDGPLGTWDATGKAGPFTLNLYASDTGGLGASASLTLYAGSPSRTLALGGQKALDKPRGVAWAPNRIYVADTNADLVRVYDAPGNLLTSFGDKRRSLKLNKPAGLAVDSAGNIFVADANNKRVVKLSAAGNLLLEFGGKRFLDKPVAVALAGGKVLVADAQAGEVVVFSEAGALLARVALPAAPGPDEDAAEPRPLALAAEASGAFWVADSKGGRVLRYDAAFNLVQTIPGFERPEGLAVSPSGACLAVVDSKAERVRTFDAARGAELAAFGKDSLHRPAQAVFTADGQLLVANRNEDQVTGFGLPGTPVIIAMTQSKGGFRASSSDGAPLASEPVVARVGRVEGGFVEEPGGAAVEVPAGAVETDLDISVAVVPETGVAERQALHLGAVSSPREFGPHGLSFSVPVTITLPYDPNLVAGARPEELKIHYWNAERSAWEELASRVDADAHTVSAQTSHFSLYQILAPVRALSLMADPEATFSLRSVYAFPNPAVGGQKPTIHVAVGKADRVTIRIYDIAGTPVHEASLDGAPSVVNDESGAHFAYEYAWAGHIPSGVYLYTITAEKAGNAPIKRVGKLAVVR